jgi:prolyl 4-hydroxylase
MLGNRRRAVSPLLCLLLLLLCASRSSGSWLRGLVWGSKDLNDYGVDVTYPIHRFLQADSYYGKRYQELIQGCWTRFTKKECEKTERDRMERNYDQPQSQHNYTRVGSKKIRLPEDVIAHLEEYVRENRHKKYKEDWPPAYTYINFWDSPTYIIGIDEEEESGRKLQHHVQRAVKPFVEEWTGQKVVESGFYGIRIYTKDSIIPTHVDRLPLVSSLIINVFQEDMEGEWPLEVYSHNGKAHNITLEPGDAVMYESHTVLHGRPFPLKKGNYANLFVHYIPVDHDVINRNDYDAGLLKVKPTPIAQMVRGMNRLPHKAMDEGVGVGVGVGSGSSHDIKKSKQKQVKQEDTSEDQDQGRTALHIAALSGDVREVQKIMNNNRNTDIIHVRDINAWQPLHDATRSGDLATVKLLLELGADLNSKTNGGGTPLWLARHLLGDDHEIVKYYQSINAPEVGIDLEVEVENQI